MTFRVYINLEEDYGERSATEIVEDFIEERIRLEKLGLKFGSSIKDKKICVRFFHPYIRSKLYGTKIKK